MVPLIASSADDVAELRSRLSRALDGGPAVALGAGTFPATVADGTALVLMTSGSTGVPKSVVLSRSALLASAMATAARIGSGAWLLALSASYIAGVQVLVRSILSGHDAAVLSGRFTAEAFAEATAALTSSARGQHVPAYTALVPAQLATLLDAAEHDAGVARAVRSFQAILVGGQAMPAPLRERATAAGARVVRTYGSSETAGGCVYDGIPLDGVRARLVDGELQLSGPVLADGYLSDAELTAERFVRDADGSRWYRTGDAGEVERIGAEQAVRVLGRLDNVIVSGGVNVSLDRVEAIVQSIPGLEHAVVVPVPDDRWGEASVVVAPAPHDDLDAVLTGVRAAVAAALGAPARPARLLVVTELPRLTSGKPDRQALRRLVRERW